MHSEIALAEILFRLIIFSLLALKILQLTKQYFIPYLHGEIKREKVVRIELIEKGNFINSTQNKIENQIKNQKKLFTDVEKNVQKWHSFIKEERDQAEKVMHEVKAAIEKKRDIQRKNYVLTTTYSQAIPKAIDLAQHEIAAFFASPNGQTAFNKLIEKL